MHNATVTKWYIYENELGELIFNNRFKTLVILNFWCVVDGDGPEVSAGVGPGQGDGFESCAVVVDAGLAFPLGGGLSGFDWSDVAEWEGDPLSVEFG